MKSIGEGVAEGGPEEFARTSGKIQIHTRRTSERCFENDPVISFDKCLTSNFGQ